MVTPVGPLSRNASSSALSSRAQTEAPASPAAPTLTAPISQMGRVHIRASKSGTQTKPGIQIKPIHFKPPLTDQDDELR